MPLSQTETELGYWDNLSNANPALYKTLESWADVGSRVGLVLRAAQDSAPCSEDPVHLTFKMGIDNGWGEDQTRLVVAAPGGEVCIYSLLWSLSITHLLGLDLVKDSSNCIQGFIVVHIASHVFSEQNLSQEKINQFCLNIRDVICRISHHKWNSLNHHEQVEVLSAANEPIKSGRSQYSPKSIKRIEYTEMFHEAMGVQVPKAATPPRSRLNQSTVDPLKNQVSQKDLTTLEGKLDDLIIEFNALVSSVAKSKGPGVDRRSAPSTRHDTFERGRPSARATPPTANAKPTKPLEKEYDCWGNVVKNPYLPTTIVDAYAAWSLGDGDPFSGSQARSKNAEWWKKGKGNPMSGSMMPGNWVETPVRKFEDPETPVPKGKGSGSKGRQDQSKLPDVGPFDWDRCDYSDDEVSAATPETQPRAHWGDAKAPPAKPSRKRQFGVGREPASAEDGFDHVCRGHSHGPVVPGYYKW